MTDTRFYAIARKLVDGALADGGASIWIGEEVEHGYLVGLPGRGLQILEADQIPHDYDAVVSKVAAWCDESAAVESAATWGSWIDGETRIAYFDVSSHHASEGDAATATVNRGEIAWWDVAAGCERRPFGR